MDGFSARAFIGESQYLLQYLVSGIIISFYTFLIITLKDVLKEINNLIDFQIKVDQNIKKSVQRLLLDRSKVIYDICSDLNDVFGIPFILISFFKILDICNNMLFMISKLSDNLLGIYDYSEVFKGSITRFIPPSILFAMSFQGHLITVQVRLFGFLFKELGNLIVLWGGSVCLLYLKKFNSLVSFGRGLELLEVVKRNCNQNKEKHIIAMNIESNGTKPYYFFNDGRRHCHCS